MMQKSHFFKSRQDCCIGRHLLARINQIQIKRKWYEPIISYSWRKKSILTSFFLISRSHHFILFINFPPLIISLYYIVLNLSQCTCMPQTATLYTLPYLSHQNLLQNCKMLRVSFPCQISPRWRQIFKPFSLPFGCLGYILRDIWVTSDVVWVRCRPQLNNVRCCLHTSW